jgi:hypothetical protein
MVDVWANISAVDNVTLSGDAMGPLPGTGPLVSIGMWDNTDAFLGGLPGEEGSYQIVTDATGNKENVNVSKLLLPSAFNALAFSYDDGC